VTQGSWAQFGSGSPAATPVRTTQASSSHSNRTDSTNGSGRSTGASSDGYFDSQTSSWIGSPRRNEPVLLQNQSFQAEPKSLQSFGLGSVIEDPSAVTTSAPTASADSAPSSLDSAPSSADSAPSSADSAPSSADSAPSSADSAPSSADSAPSSADSAPSSVDLVDAGDEGDGSDDGSPDGSEGTSSHNHELAVQPSAAVATSFAPARPSAPLRPSLYSQPSRSMVNLSSSAPTRERQMDADLTRREDKVSTAPQLETIRSREVAPSRIDLPRRTPVSNVVSSGMTTPSEWARPPPTPVTGTSDFFWGKNKAEDSKLKRRRSADDLLAPPPDYEPPLPGAVIPLRRDEEGKEKLPKYWCAVSI